MKLQLPPNLPPLSLPVDTILCFLFSALTDFHLGSSKETKKPTAGVLTSRWKIKLNNVCRIRYKFDVAECFWHFILLSPSRDSYFEDCSSGTCRRKHGKGYQGHSGIYGFDTCWWICWGYNQKASGIHSFGGWTFLPSNTTHTPTHTHTHTNTHAFALRG